jgi:hypothetical protein
MTIDRIFIAFMVACGLVTAAILILYPESRDARVSPYFWVLIPMAMFELAAFARGRGEPGSVITVYTRLIGFVIAIGLMLAIPYLAGQPVVQLF